MFPAPDDRTDPHKRLPDARLPARALGLRPCMMIAGDREARLRKLYRMLFLVDSSFLVLTLPQKV
jgi:hypothetical protein